MPSIQVQWKTKKTPNRTSKMHQLNPSMEMNIHVEKRKRESQKSNFGRFQKDSSQYLQRNTT